MEDVFGPDQQASLCAWMDARGLSTGPIVNAVPLTGGTQNVLIRFDRGDQAFVMRRPSAHPRPGANGVMRREARMLAALAGSDVPVPVLQASCDDETVVGAAFYLMEPVDGFNPVAGLPPLHAGSATIQHHIGLAMADAIAALADVDYIAAGLADFGRIDGFLERQVSRWASQLDSYRSHTAWPGPAALPDVERIAAWLSAHRPDHFQPGIIHGDFHMANVMVRPDSGDLAAVIDWELTTIGDPLIDLGWLLSAWPDADGPGVGTVGAEPWIGFPTAVELIARYGQRSSRSLAAIDWYTVLACYKFGIILEGSHARALDGLSDLATGQQLHASAVALFERARRLIS